MLKQTSDKTRKPSPYAFMERPNGWRVFRETYKPAPEDESKLNPTYYVSHDIHSDGLSAHEAITRCAELNGEHMPMHPLDAILHLFVLATTQTNSGAEVGACLAGALQRLPLPARPHRAAPPG